VPRGIADRFLKASLAAEQFTLFGEHPDVSLGCEQQYTPARRKPSRRRRGGGGSGGGQRPRLLCPTTGDASLPTGPMVMAPAVDATRWPKVPAVLRS